MEGSAHFINVGLGESITQDRTLVQSEADGQGPGALVRPPLTRTRSPLLVSGQGSRVCSCVDAPSHVRDGSRPLSIGPKKSPPCVAAQGGRFCAVLGTLRRPHA